MSEQHTMTRFARIKRWFALWFGVWYRVEWTRETGWTKTRDWPWRRSTKA